MAGMTRGKPPVDRVEVTVTRDDGTVVKYAAAGPPAVEVILAYPPFSVMVPPPIAGLSLHVEGGTITMEQSPAREDERHSARVALAWLMWCYGQGYADPADRAILRNWMGDDTAGLHPDDVKAQRALLAMADEILAAASGAGG